MHLRICATNVYYLTGFEKYLVLFDREKYIFSFQLPTIISYILFYYRGLPFEQF